MSKNIESKTSELLTSESQSVEKLHKRIAVLEHMVEREKKTRNLAEHELERYSLEIYETNQSLKSALAFSIKKKSELEYLSKASMEVASELPLNEMISNIVELTCQYCAAQYGFYFVTQDGVRLDQKHYEAWCKEHGWHSQNELQKLVNTSLPLSELEVLDSWFVSAVCNDDYQYSEQFGRVLYMNFTLSDGKVGWLAFLIKMDLVDDEIFPILATAREHITSGIKRRLSDERILKRNVQLQDSVSNLENAKRLLIQSERMASLGHLATGIAHEINNPVAFILSNMNVLKEYLKDYKRLHDSLKNELAIHKSLNLTVFTSLCEKIDLTYIDEDAKDLLISNIGGLNRIRIILDNLSGFSQDLNPKLIQMSLNKCVDDALKITGNVFKSGHQVDNQLTDLCPLVLGDLGQLQQVFVNLFISAANAMKVDGKLSISQTEDNHRVIIHIKYNGSGMGEETIEKLFTPFFTTGLTQVGIGLGFSVSRVVLEAHDAQISVDSQLGLGTTFNLSFPVSI